MRIRRHFIRGLGVMTLAVSLLGCQTSQTPKSTQKKTANKMYQLLEKQRLQIEALREENTILKSSRKSPNEKRSIRNQKVLLKKYKIFSDKRVYEQALRAYHEQKLNKLVELRGVLEARSEYNPFLDNVIMLQAQLHMDKGQFSKAISLYNQVIQKHPKSEVRSRAILQKGFAYKILNLTKFAEKTFSNLVETYPGSPETARAKLELKLLNKKL